MRTEGGKRKLLLPFLQNSRGLVNPFHKVKWYPSQEILVYRLITLVVFNFSHINLLMMICLVVFWLIYFRFLLRGNFAGRILVDVSFPFSLFPFFSLSLISRYILLTFSSLLLPPLSPPCFFFLFYIFFFTVVE